MKNKVAEVSGTMAGSHALVVAEVAVADRLESAGGGPVNNADCGGGRWLTTRAQWRAPRQLAGLSRGRHHFHHLINDYNRAVLGLGSPVMMMAKIELTDHGLGWQCQPAVGTWKAADLSSDSRKLAGK